MDAKQSIIHSAALLVRGYLSTTFGMNYRIGLLDKLNAEEYIIKIEPMIRDARDISFLVDRNTVIRMLSEPGFYRTIDNRIFTAENDEREKWRVRNEFIQRNNM